MADDPNLEVTHILQAAARGESDAPNRLLPLVYAELHQLPRLEMTQVAHPILSQSRRTLETNILK